MRALLAGSGRRSPYRAGHTFRAVLVVLGLILLLVARSSAPDRSGTTRDSTSISSPVHVRSHDGTMLEGRLVRPRGATGGPLVVMPASWGQQFGEYGRLATVFAQHGWTALPYTQRGFGGSGGHIDFAGTDTQRDASDVVSWALRTLVPRPSRVAMLGISYGAGVSLLAAARDPRITAVAALSTWADLGAALAPDGLVNTRSLGLLLTDAVAPRLDRELATFRRELTADPQHLAAQLPGWARSRSPAGVLDTLNRRHTAVMLGGGFADSIFPTTQLVPFFDRLTGAKELDLAAGDHGQPEAPALDGRRSAVIDAAIAFLDRQGGPRAGRSTLVRLQDQTTHRWRTFAGWPGRQDARLTLAAPFHDGGPPQQIGAGAQAPWTASLRAGLTSAADSGPTQLGDIPYHPPVLQFAALVPGTAALWAGPTLTAPQSIAGSPEVQVTLSSGGAVFAYLYDVGSGGTGTLVSWGPVGPVGPAASGPGSRVTADLQPTCWTVPAGHRLALVVTAADSRLVPSAVTGSPVAVTSDADRPATLQI